MEFVIVTGMSGAGKSRAVEALEDMGFYCVDNMPLDFLLKFAEICNESPDKLSRVAIVTDIRSGRDFKNFINDLSTIKSIGINYRLLYIDAKDEAIIKRYKETRRRHPLVKNGTDGSSIHTCITKERNMLMPLYEKADRIIDTSYYTPAQLKEQIVSLFSDGGQILDVSILSFGFKYGIPMESDLVFDVRCLPNPYYELRLRNLTGMNPEVQEFVFGSENAAEYFKKICEMVEFVLPLFRAEGKANANISIGCTGGKHRSVSFAQRLKVYLQEKGIESQAIHRDVLK